MKKLFYAAVISYVVAFGVLFQTALNILHGEYIWAVLDFTLGILNLETGKKAWDLYQEKP